MRVLHSGHIARFGYRPNHEHAGELRIRTAAHEFALRMLTSAPDDDGDRYNYRMLVACLQAAGLTQWLVNDNGAIRLNSYDQSQSNACAGHGRSMQIAHEDAAAAVTAGAPAANAPGTDPAAVPVFKAMPAPEIQYPFGLMVDGTLGRDNGCSGSGIVEGSERYGTWYELNVDGDSDELVEGNWAGSPDIPTWYQRIEQYATRGVPAAIAAAAAAHKSQSHANVTTVAQAWASIGNGYPALLCSNISYEAPRNEEGIIRATGHDWPHCMVATSRRTSPKYGRLYLVHQSWQTDWTSGPYYLDQPAGSFWVTEADLATMLVCQWDRRTVVRDCWTSTGHQGFTARADQLPQWVKAA
jgi:hypothetical protein